LGRTYLEELVGGYWEVSDSFAGGVEYGVGHGGGYAGDADFAYAAAADGVEVEVGDVDELYFQGMDIGVNRDGVVGKVVVDRPSGAEVVVGVFGEGLAEAHHDSAHHLAAGGSRVEHFADVHHAHHPRHLDERD